MVSIDPDSGGVTVRIVYDGPAGAGKTTNVRVLHETLFSARAGSLESPGSPGRITQFFDWRALDAGYLDGRPMRVHVLSVPGQWPLRARRQLLLRSADAVCFVADASPRRMTQQLRMFASLRDAVPDLDAKLVVQLNKVDLPDAIAPDALVAALGLPSTTRVVSARAHDHIGVSETFLAASRLATANLSTVRQQRSSSLAQTPEELHEQLAALGPLPWEVYGEVDWSEPD